MTSSHLEVYDYSKDEDSGQQVHQVGQILAVEGLTQSTDLVLPGGQKVEQGDDCSLEFCATTCSMR